VRCWTKVLAANPLNSSRRLWIIAVFAKKVTKDILVLGQKPGLKWLQPVLCQLYNFLNSLSHWRRFVQNTDFKAVIMSARDDDLIRSANWLKVSLKLYLHICFSICFVSLLLGVSGSGIIIYHHCHQLLDGMKLPYIL
jgi:hypothetical protein